MIKGLAVSCLTLIFLYVADNTTAAVETIEPPSWWLGMEHSEIELLLRGSNLIDVVEVTAEGAEIIDVHQPGTDHSLFVTINFSELESSGPIVLEVRYSDGVSERLHFPLLQRSSHPLKAAGFSQKDLIYLLTPDRFANGDPSNDTLDTMLEATADRSEPYGRHGGDLAGINSALTYLDSLGVTRLWMNPILENDMAESSYHGYAITNLYRVDPRFGDLKELELLSRAASERGIGLVWDAVPNHIGRNHPWMEQPPEGDWIHPEDISGISSHRREVLLDPHRVEADIARLANGWFVPAMPDLNQSNQRLARYLLQNMIWWVERIGISAIRVDTMPYNDRVFMHDWLAGLKREYPTLSIVGEEWSYQAPIVAQWQALGSTSMMDFPLNNAILKSLTEEESWNSGIGRLYQALAADWLYTAPYDLVIFSDNHDMSRVHTALGEREALTRMALALTATLRGVPQVFYGTELLLSHPGTESHGALRMDFPGGWEGDTTNAFTGKGLPSQTSEFQRWFRDLFSWRKSSSGIAEGTFTHLAPVDGVYAYLRNAETERVLVVVNNNADPRNIDTRWLSSLVPLRGNWRAIPSGENRILGDDTSIPGKTVWILEQRAGDIQ